jgi:hypothetical protein
MTTADTLLHDADLLLSEKRYADCLITLAAALEIALATCLSSMLVRKPSGQRNATPPEVQLLHKRYMTNIGNLPVRGLCNVTMNVIARRLQPHTIAEALDVIEKSKRFATSMPTPERVAAIDDPNARAAVESLRDCSIVDLRNKVVHQSHKATAEDVVEQRATVTGLVNALRGVFGEAAR